jgi:hypothetical protein
MIRRRLRRIIYKTKVFLDKYDTQTRIAVVIAVGHLFYIHYG